MWSFSSVGWWRRLKLGSGDTILEPAKHELRVILGLILRPFGRRSGRLSASVGGYSLSCCGFVDGLHN
ncbi:hypothetical protein CASFOL_001527 [Castilleja foliolosa]|uniref:Uncharacterized protein n=1 Tax=Castilleja foliolosa TaxID=1961234 RepID=A0ABD3EJE7_9LAMI